MIVSLPRLLIHLYWANTTSEARRLISQNSIKLNGAVIKDFKVNLEANETYSINRGKQREVMIILAMDDNFYYCDDSGLSVFECLFKLEDVRERM